jgi:hypothetical protein
MLSAFWPSTFSTRRSIFSYGKFVSSYPFSVSFEQDKLIFFFILYLGYFFEVGICVLMNIEKEVKSVHFHSLDSERKLSNLKYSVLSF